MPDVYLIDGNAVNGRPDWTNPPAVSSTAAARQETFPGSGVTFTMTAERRGPQIVIEGWLEANTSKALRQAVAAADALRFDGQTHDVKILDTTYRDCQLVRPLSVLGKPVAFAYDNQIKLRQKVRYVWQQLSIEGAT